MTLVGDSMSAFTLLAIAFLVFDVELLFLYPWAVVISPAGPPPAVQAAKVSASGMSPRGRLCSLPAGQ